MSPGHMVRFHRPPGNREKYISRLTSPVGEILAHKLGESELAKVQQMK